MTSGFTINPTLLISLVSLVSGYKTAQTIQFQNLNPSTQVIPKLKSNFLLKIQSFRTCVICIFDYAFYNSCDGHMQTS